MGYILTGLFLTLNPTNIQSNSTRINDQMISYPTNSTDPGNPDVLVEDVAEYDFFNNTATSFYYQTQSVQSDHYDVVWLQSELSVDDWDLLLYSDSGYSNFSAISTRGGGMLDWVVFRPNTTQYYFYPLVTALNETGYAYIEWEESTSLLPGDSVSASLGSSECVELYEVVLYNTTAYDFTLDVPSTGEFYLYLYYLNLGDGTGPDLYIKGSQNGFGVDQAILNYTPPSTGKYAIFVVRFAYFCGSGSFILNFDYYTPPTTPPEIPGFALITILFGVGIGLLFKRLGLTRRFEYLE